MVKHKFKPERAEEFNKMLMNTFRYKMADANDIAILASVCQAWATKLKAKEYPDTLMSFRLVTTRAIDA
jgi:hypothetical protein